MSSHTTQDTQVLARRRARQMLYEALNATREISSNYERAEKIAHQIEAWPEVDRLSLISFFSIPASRLNSEPG